MSETTPCPCGSGLEYTACCEPYISGKMRAPGPEALMRSRYTAYTLGNSAYLRQTWHPSTCPAELDFSAPQPRWISLSVISARQSSVSSADVEFVARFRVGGRAQRLHETSRFELVNERWYYLDGEIHS